MQACNAQTAAVRRAAAAQLLLGYERGRRPVGVVADSLLKRATLPHEQYCTHY